MISALNLKLAFIFRLFTDFNGAKKAIRFKVNKPAVLSGFSLFGPKNGEKVAYDVDMKVSLLLNFILKHETLKHLACFKL